MITGLVALLAVAITVGVLVGGAALVAARVAGVDSDSSAGQNAADGPGKGKETLYLPRPSMSESPTGPSISLAPGQTSTTNSQPSSSATDEESEASSITLQGPSSVKPMANIDLTGAYPDGEGAVLQVQRFEEGKWVDFLSVNALVTNSVYSTYVQTSRPGPMKWRMIDTSTGQTSNPITVTVES